MKTNLDEIKAADKKDEKRRPLMWGVNVASNEEHGKIVTVKKMKKTKAPPPATGFIKTTTEDVSRDKAANKDRIVRLISRLRDEGKVSEAAKLQDKYKDIIEGVDKFAPAVGKEPYLMSRKEYIIK